MARIKSKMQLKEYILNKLGAPLVKVEITDTQISDIIDDTVQKFTEYAYGDLEDTVIVQFNGAGSYDLPDTITNILDISKGSTSNLTNFSANFGAGYVPDLWSESYFSGSLTGDIIPSIVSISTTKAILDKYFADGMVYNFNHLNKKIKLLENYFGPAVVFYQYEYIADEDNDLVYNHEWIKNYSTAMTKLIQSDITGKFEQNLVGGARINHEKMQSRAETDIEKLNEELMNKWSDPAPISIA
jgi:hypothetical protein